MCGRICRIKDNSTLIIKASGGIPPEYIIRKPGSDSFAQGFIISSHRFVKKEKLRWWCQQWKGKNPIETVLLDADLFTERGEDGKIHTFQLPKDNSIVAMIHPPLKGRWTNGPPPPRHLGPVSAIDIVKSPEKVISIITTVSTGRVADVHHRMPLSISREKWLVA